MTSSASERTRTPRDGYSRAASSPAMTARYSATLFVVTPMRSLTAASGSAGSEASKTTAPIAAGPGLPRAPPSHATTNHSLIFFRSWRCAPARSGPAPLRAGIPGSRPLRSRHHQDAAAVVAGRDRATGRSDLARVELPLDRRRLRGHRLGLVLVTALFTRDFVAALTQAGDPGSRAGERALVLRQDSAFRK